MEEKKSLVKRLAAALKAKWEQRRETLDKLPNKERLKKRYKEIGLWAALLFAAEIVAGAFFTPIREAPLVLLSNAFMISGLAITAWGMIRIGDYHGCLDVALYNLNRSISLLGPKADSPEEREKRSKTMADFQEERKTHRVTPWPLFFVGVPLLILSALLGAAAV